MTRGLEPHTARALIFICECWLKLLVVGPVRICGHRLAEGLMQAVGPLQFSPQVVSLPPSSFRRCVTVTESGTPNGLTPGVHVFMQSRRVTIHICTEI